MDHLTIKQALPLFYAKYGLQPDGGIGDPTVKIDLFKGFSLYFPNFKARKQAVLRHDIHHLVTEYTAEIKGETEISAWELSTGCSQNWAAFTINTYSFMSGILFNPARIWKAWLKGRTTDNLYYKKYTDEELLNRTVIDLKEELGFFIEDHVKEDSSGAFWSFLIFLLFGIVFSVVSVVIIPFVLIFSSYVALLSR